MLRLYHIITSIYQLLKQINILFIDSVDHILIHEVSIQILRLLPIKLLPLPPLFVYHLISVEWTWTFFGSYHLSNTWSRLRFILKEFLNLDVLLPLVLEFKLEVCVILFVGFSSHGQVFQGEVPLFVDVSIVVLGDFRRWNIVFRPFAFDASWDLSTRFKNRVLFMCLHRRLARQRPLIFNLTINIYHIFILVKLLYSRVLHLLLFLVNSALTSRIII